MTLVSFSHSVELKCDGQVFLTTALMFPSGYKNVELITRNYKGTQFDLMFAYDDDKDEGSLYLGNWSEGVI